MSKARDLVEAGDAFAAIVDMMHDKKMRGRLRGWLGMAARRYASAIESARMVDVRRAMRIRMARGSRLVHHFALIEAEGVTGGGPACALLERARLTA